jgi:signal transduction histidine kinase/HAMP domain-containing protein/putative methionine-R-sulfoxide reductase with GAF domain
MLLATALFTLLAGALTWWMLKRELSPMLATAQQLADMSNQDRPLQILPIKRQDEVGQLVGGFNRLMAALSLREAALQERDAFSHAILNSVTAEIAVLDRDGVIVAVNQPWQRFALENGVTPGQTSPRTGIGANYLAICQSGSGLPADGAMDAHAGIRAVTEGRLPRYRLEYPCHSPQQQRWFSLSVTPLGSAAGGVVVAHTDITERKATELRLQRLTHLYAASSHCSQAIVRCASEAELFAKICRDMVTFGRMKMAWIGLIDEASQQLLPVASWGDAQGYLDNIRISVDATDPFGQGPAAHAVHDQKPFWCQDFCHDPLTAPWHERGAMAGWGASAGLPLLRNGQVVGVFSVYSAEPNAFDEDTRQLLSDMATDISFALDGFEREAARRAAEGALASTTDLLQRTGEMARIGGWELDLVNLRLHWSAETCRIHEIDSLAAPPLDQAINFYAPEARAVLQAAVQAGIDQGTPWDLELPLITAKGRRIWVRAQGTTHMLNGQAVKLVGAFQDITERKLIEVALREAEAHKHALISAIPDLIFTNRGDGEYLSVHAADQAGLLLQPDVFLNRKVGEVLPQPIAGQIMQAFAEALATGTIQLLNYPMLMQGQERHYEARIVPSADDILITIVRDVTERQLGEQARQRYTQQLKALSRRVLEAQEAERRRLAIELHDELGQLLTAIKINLQSSERFKDRHPGEHNAENIQIVEDALQQVRRLALALRPSMLDDLGLAPALRWMAEQSAARNGFAVEFYTTRLSDRLAADIEIACFRIAQEALTNIARYAQAKNVGIQMLQDGAELVLSVQDDGCGFDVAAMRAGALAGGSIGVLGMQERAALIGGQLDIESAPGATTVRLRCPLRLRGDAA